jgi:hypothetical protein
MLDGATTVAEPAADPPVTMGGGADGGALLGDVGAVVGAGAGAEVEPDVDDVSAGEGDAAGGGGGGACARADEETKIGAASANDDKKIKR